MSRADLTARTLADELGLTDLPINPDKAAKALGIMVVRQPGAMELSGMLLRRDGQLAIGLNPQRPRASQRFALAHIIGHARLHRRRDLILDITDRTAHGPLTSLPTDREEAEANRFAGALLMPEAAVRRHAADTQFETAAQLVTILADQFDVSEMVMGYRLLTLGIIGDS
ncbi:MULTISPECIES: ImmA/IrrE family metallo-endopeptidase [unclassified Streptomyces]|uniref:ImmA/IrrE family metallo-endopeptidase n=1 Tax=unclassified Streptomyces TaxID=2593676 RepID=UPI00340A8BB0